MAVNLTPKKSLGQNFLIDPHIHERIVEHIDPKEGETFIEIGPGTGMLTRALLATPLTKLVAFELDERAVPQLRIEFRDEGERFEVIEKDILKVDLGEVASHINSTSLKEEGKLRVAGNIPYYITAPILFRLIEQRQWIKDATLLVQLEVAERLTAEPRTKAYGIPTVLANFFGEVKFLFKVKAGAFRPVPKVDSAVIRIDFEKGYFARTGLTPPPHFIDTKFQSFVRGLFAMRRKTIRNNLKSMSGQPGLVTAEGLKSLEERNAQVLTQRAEELVIPELLELFSEVSQRDISE